MGDMRDTKVPRGHMDGAKVVLRRTVQQPADFVAILGDEAVRGDAWSAGLVRPCAEHERQHERHGEHPCDRPAPHAPNTRGRPTTIATPTGTPVSVASSTGVPLEGCLGHVNARMAMVS